MARKPQGSGPAATVHDQRLVRGNGGELHQRAEGDTPLLTTAQGVPVADDQNTLRIGQRGPSLIEDFHFREKIFHFDSLAKYTRADIFRLPLSCLAAERQRAVSSI